MFKTKCPDRVTFSGASSLTTWLPMTLVLSHLYLISTFSSSRSLFIKSWLVSTPRLFQVQRGNQNIRKGRYSRGAGLKENKHSSPVLHSSSRVDNEQGGERTFLHNTTSFELACMERERGEGGDCFLYGNSSLVSWDKYCLAHCST